MGPAPFALSNAIVPDAPVDLAVSHLGNIVFTFGCLATLLVAIGLAARPWFRRRDAFPLLCLASGGLSTIFESILDVNGGVWWPTHGDWEAYKLAGVAIPWLVPMAYSWIFGGQAYVAFLAFRRRASAGELWKLWGLFALTDLVADSAGVLLGAYAYFGPQPVNPYGFPLWYLATNATTPLVAGAVFWLLRPHFKGLRSLGLVAVVPMSVALVYSGVGFPMWLSLQSNWPHATAYAALAATVLLTYLLIKTVLVATGSIGAASAIGSGDPPATAVTDIPEPAPVRVSTR